MRHAQDQIPLVSSLHALLSPLLQAIRKMRFLGLLLPLYHKEPMFCPAVGDFLVADVYKGSFLGARALSKVSIDHCRLAFKPCNVVLDIQSAIFFGRTSKKGGNFFLTPEVDEKKNLEIDDATLCGST